MSNVVTTSANLTKNVVVVHVGGGFRLEMSVDRARTFAREIVQAADMLQPLQTPPLPPEKGHPYR